MAAQGEVNNKPNKVGADRLASALPHATAAANEPPRYRQPAGIPGDGTVPAGPCARMQGGTPGGLGRSWSGSWSRPGDGRMRDRRTREQVGPDAPLQGQ